MTVSFYEGIGLTGPPRRRRVKVKGVVAGQERVIESPRRLSKIRAHEERLVPDHHIAKKRFIGFRELTEGRLIIELQGMVGQDGMAGRDS